MNKEDIQKHFDSIIEELLSIDEKIESGTGNQKDNIRRKEVQENLLSIIKVIKQEGLEILIKGKERQ